MIWFIILNILEWKLFGNMTMGFFKEDIGRDIYYCLEIFIKSFIDNFIKYR